MRAPASLIGIAVGFAVALPVVVARADTAVTSCGQSYSGAGYLTGDLACAGYAGVTIVGRGSLDLRGFTLSGADYAILCGSKCKVFGGGTVTAAWKDGIASLGTLEVADVTVTSNGIVGLFAERKIKATDLVLADNGKGGLQVFGKLKLTDSVVSGNGYGANANGLMQVRGSTISGNSRGGLLYASRLSLRDSSVTGNVLDPDCGVGQACADLMALSPEETKPPRLKNSVCDTSYVGYGGELPGLTLGVCALD
jgi:hypothetical protein